MQTKLFVLLLLISNSSLLCDNVCVITGELSGDYLGAWYLEKVTTQQEDTIHVIGGPLLRKKATHIITERQNIANTTNNLFEFAKHYCFLNSIHYQLLKYIRTYNITKIVLIDTP